MMADLVSRNMLQCIITRQLCIVFGRINSSLVKFVFLTVLCPHRIVLNYVTI